MNLGIETEYIEFKQSTSQLGKALESMAAMLNKHGEGEVYFGVLDNGDVVGQDIGSRTLKDISDAVSSRIKPTVIPDISVEKHERKQIIRVAVTGYNKPYSADGKYVIRSGNENRKIEPEKLKEMIFMNSGEQIIEMESYNQDLTFNQLQQLYILKDYTIDRETFAKNTGLLCRNGKFNQLAEILSDSNDCSIKVVRFAGTDKSAPAIRDEYGYKCLLLAMQQALDYVNSLNETRIALSESSIRKEQKLFDGNSLREAWNNACLHTRWSQMIPPVINIFSNRIEIVSNGGLPADYPLEDFYAGISHPVNRQLQKIMGQLGYVEQTGHGVPEIIKHYGREAFDITENRMIVTLSFPYELEMKNMDFSNLNESQKKVLMAIKTDPRILTNELTKVTDLKISRVNQIIKELKELGKLERIGSNKNGYWKVNQ